MEAALLGLLKTFGPETILTCACLLLFMRVMADEKKIIDVEKQLEMVQKNMVTKEFCNLKHQQQKDDMKEVKESIKLLFDKVDAVPGKVLQSIQIGKGPV